MELGRQGRRPRRPQGIQAPHRGRAAPLRAVSAGGVSFGLGTGVHPASWSATCRSLGGVMAKDKSILEKFTETVKDVAKTAADAASFALKTDTPALKADERAVAYMPLAADGLVSDPLMVPPVAPVRKRKPAIAKRAAKKASKKSAAKKSAAKTTKRTARKSTGRKSNKTTRKIAKKSAGKSQKAIKRKAKK